MNENGSDGAAKKLNALHIGVSKQLEDVLSSIIECLPLLEYERLHRLYVTVSDELTKRGEGL